MARYTGPVCRLCRREKVKLMLKGDRCLTAKCAVERREYPPGQHGQRMRSKVSDYGQQLREKQKARRTYGVLERQFRKTMDSAERMTGITGENLVQLLERRLDNVVYRLGFASSRAQARQLVCHGHFTVGGQPVDIPSFLVAPGQEIGVRDKSRSLVVINAALENSERSGMAPWVSRDRERMTGALVRLPQVNEVGLPVREQLIVELYSR